MHHMSRCPGVQYWNNLKLIAAGVSMVIEKNETTQDFHTVLSMLVSATKVLMFVGLNSGRGHNERTNKLNVKSSTTLWHLVYLFVSILNVCIGTSSDLSIECLCMFCMFFYTLSHQNLLCLISLVIRQCLFYFLGEDSVFVIQFKLFYTFCTFPWSRVIIIIIFFIIFF